MLGSRAIIFRRNVMPFSTMSCKWCLRSMSRTAGRACATGFTSDACSAREHRSQMAPLTTLSWCTWDSRRLEMVGVHDTSGVHSAGVRASMPKKSSP